MRHDTRKAKAIAKAEADFERAWAKVVRLGERLEKLVAPTEEEIEGSFNAYTDDSHHSVVEMLFDQPGFTALEALETRRAIAEEEARDAK